MRGDSLRDLYAKTLALMGLALLGGIGALVDYWPTGSLEAPAVALEMGSALAGPSLPTAIPVRNIQNIEVPAVAPSRVARAQPVPVLIMPSKAEVEVVLSAMSLQVIRSGVVLGTPPLRSLAAPWPAADVPAIEVALSVPNLLLSSPLEPELPDQWASLEDGDNAGFLVGAAGAAKRAGSSIAAGTVKAGSTIAAGTMKVGAPLASVMRGVGNAFKRLKFF